MASITTMAIAALTEPRKTPHKHTKVLFLTFPYRGIRERSSARVGTLVPDVHCSQSPTKSIMWRQGNTRVRGLEMRVESLFHRSLCVIHPVWRTGAPGRDLVRSYLPVLTYLPTFILFPIAEAQCRSKPAYALSFLVSFISQSELNTGWAVEAHLLIPRLESP